VSLRPGSAVRQEVAGGELEEIRVAEPVWIWSMMLWHKNRWMSPAIRAFVETIKEEVGCEEEGVQKAAVKRRVSAPRR
jgi:DNA-binding transcriptional LysR family regulator